jgi:hypothetical protein
MATALKTRPQPDRSLADGHENGKDRRWGKLSGIASTSPWQHQSTLAPRLSLGTPPPPAPPAPPLLVPPSAGKMLNTRTEGCSLAFEVKGPDGKVVDFRLTLQSADAGTLNVAIPTHERAYPELQMKRVW